LIFTVCSLPIAMMSCALTAYLNANKKFFVSGLGTLLFNLGIILILLYRFNQASPLLAIGIGIFIGTILRFIAQWLSQPKAKANQFEDAPQINRVFLKNFSLASFSASIVVLIPCVMRSACSFFGDGQISAFNYANKMIEIPIGIFITNVGVVLYPLLCNTNDPSVAYQKQRTALAKTFLFSIIFLVFGLAFGRPILRLVYQRGGCSAGNIADIYYWFVWILLTMPLIAINTIFTVQLNAANKMKNVLAINVKSLFVFVLCLIIAIYFHSFFILGLSLIIFHSIYTLQAVLEGKTIKFFNLILCKKCVWITFIAYLGFYLCKILYIENSLYQITMGGILGALTIIYIYRYDEENTFNI